MARPVLTLPGALALALVVPAAAKEALPEEMKAALATIAGKDVLRHVEFLTSRECAGRDTPQPGLLVAARYLEEYYRELGLEGAGPEGRYRYEFDVPVVTYDPGDYLAVIRGDGAELAAYLPGTDFVPVRGSGSATVEGEVVFAGYGIEDAKEHYSDFQGVPVQGRVVLVLTHEPREGKRGRAFAGEEWTEHARIDRKAKAAEEHGAVAVLVATDPRHHEDRRAARGEHPRIVGHRRGPTAAIPVLHVSGELADALAGDGALLGWQERIDHKLRGAPRLLEGLRVRLQVTLTEQQAPAPNIAAIKRGTGPLRDEWIVLGAHYDHLGVDAYGRVFPGADDNGSGTACLLEIAEALAPVEIGRSVVFLHFSGEERGLLGSRAWCEKPWIPLSETVAMLNMDMVSRGRPRDIDAIGVRHSRDLAGALRQARSLTGTRLKVGQDGMEFFQRSDHYEFHKRGVPILFFMDSHLHEDYHTVDDTPVKLDGDKVAQVGRLVAGLTWLLSVREERPRAERTREQAGS